MKRTNGQGVDEVVNCLTGELFEAVSRNWESCIHEQNSSKFVYVLERLYLLHVNNM